MRVLTWNIRHGGGKRISKIVECLVAHIPDVVVLTEYRDNEYGGAIKKEVQLAGWSNVRTSNLAPNCNGLLIASRFPIAHSEPIDKHLPEPGRLLATRIGEIFLTGVYMPLQEKKVPYWEAVLSRAAAQCDIPALLIGDFNTGRHGLDELGKTFIGAHYMDRIEKIGYIDPWRSRNPATREFSWYSPRLKNGFRLDHVFASPALIGSVRDVWFSHREREMAISDHSILIVDLHG